MRCTQKMIIGLFGTAAAIGAIALSALPEYPKIRSSFYKTILRGVDTLEVQGKNSAQFCRVLRNPDTGNLSYLGFTVATERNRGWDGKTTEERIVSVFGVDAVNDPRQALLHKQCLTAIDKYNK